MTTVPERRWRRFSLKGLLFVVTTMAVAFGGLAWAIRSDALSDISGIEFGSTSGSIGIEMVALFAAVVARLLLLAVLRIRKLRTLDSSKRRWFRFSLRTFFGVVTVLCLWLGWNIHRVRERDAFIASMPTVGARLCRVVGRPMPSVPYSWAILGAKPIEGIALNPSTTEIELRRVAKLFPEAAVFVPKPVARHRGLPNLPQSGQPGGSRLVTEEMFD